MGKGVDGTHKTKQDIHMKLSIPIFCNFLYHSLGREGLEGPFVEFPVLFTCVLDY